MRLDTAGDQEAEWKAGMFFKQAENIVEGRRNLVTVLALIQSI